MPDVVRLDGAHDQAEALLPWYATGQLDPADRALVDDHLSSCGACQRQLKLERHLVEEFAALTPEVDSGWARMRAKIQPPARRRASMASALADFWNLLSRPAVATLAMAQLAILVLGGAMLLSLNRPAYRALGGTDEPTAANVIVIFRADATEGDVRDALRASGASLVGGPTSADAYLLHVPANQRVSALARLRADEDVQMAEPIDGESR
jgi:anti-sigma factor RsiW